MGKRIRGKVITIATWCMVFALGSTGGAQNAPAEKSVVQKEAAMTKHASGTFEVKLEPQSEDKAEGASLGRMSLYKQFHGGIEATSKGEMLTVMSDVKGSAGYVAVERVSGKLDGLSGTFVMQHSGTMTRGAQQQSVTVVPDSGTGELKGLAGKMTILIAEGKHSYEFEYTLDPTH
jgi:hypothetical protein